LAAKEGHISITNYLLEKEANCKLKIDKEQNLGRTSLHLAARYGKLDMCQLLVSKGSYIDALNSQRYTPLHVAEKEEKTSVANYLLEKGANYNLKTSEETFTHGRFKWSTRHVSVTCFQGFRYRGFIF
jgi:ankyrin repeat protein